MSAKQARESFLDALLNSPTGSSKRVIGDQFAGLKTARQQMWFLDHMIDTYPPGSYEHEIVTQLRDLFTGQVSA